MKTYTVTDIRALHPCYDPTRYVPEDWTGTALDVLRLEAAPAADRLWVASQWLGDATLRCFAAWCARQALALIDDPDPRSLAACDVAERFAHGKASREELDAARDAARDAAWAAARDAARAAARAAAWAAAWDAAWAAARAATWAAARDAAWAAARDAARDAAWAAQIEHLIAMVEAAENPSPSAQPAPSMPTPRTNATCRGSA